jgi:hypothetical protein
MDTCELCKFLEYYSCNKCGGKTKMYYKEEDKVYCMYCSPLAVDFSILWPCHKYGGCPGHGHNRPANFSEIHCYGGVSINDISDIPSGSDQEDDLYSNPHVIKFKINGYTCTLCGGYDKYYALIDKESKSVVTHSKRLNTEDLIVLCSGCANGHFSTEKRDDRIYHRKTSKHKSSKIIDPDVETIFDILDFKN